MDTSQAYKILYSTYVIDGLKQDQSPGVLLDSVSVEPYSSHEAIGESIVDESADIKLKAYEYDDAAIYDYLARLAHSPAELSLPYAGVQTRCAIASALIDALWLKGHFRLGNIRLSAHWAWNDDAVGSMAAFYDSAKEAAEYIDALGISLLTYELSMEKDSLGVRFDASVDSDDEADAQNYFATEPFRVDAAYMLGEPALPNQLQLDPKSWLVYIPFDTGEYRIGASKFAQVMGLGGAALTVRDADYFMDCYEVVREFVEDGVLLAAHSVGEAGLLAAVDAMCTDNVGIQINVSDLLAAAQCKSTVRALFAELPGVLVQIKDCEFDYLDAELLLQDVAYYPLGHPKQCSSRVSVDNSAKTGIQSIIETLMLNAEGED